MFYVNENLQCKSLTTEIDNLPEAIFLEVNVQSPNGYLWVVKNHQVKTKIFLSVIYLRLLMHFQQNKDNILLMGDFNLTIEKKKTYLEELQMHFQQNMTIFC